MEKSKKYLLISLAILLLATFITMFSTNLVANASAINPNKIIVKGNYEKCFAPDTAYISVSIETLNSSLDDAKLTNDKAVNEVINVLVNNNVEEKDISKKGYNLFEQYELKNNLDPTFNNVVCSGIEFKTHDIENLSTLLQNLKDNGVNRVNHIKFCIEDKASKSAEVFNGAIENAKEKALAIAGENSNLVITEVIEEYSYSNDCCYDDCYMPRMYNKLYSSSFENIRFQASVKVVFENK